MVRLPIPSTLGKGSGQILPADGPCYGWTAPAFDLRAHSRRLSRPRTNIRMMGIEIGAFKAANAIHFVSGSDAVS